MNKKFRKYISGGIAAALLLTTMPQQMVAQANSDNTDNIEKINYQTVAALDTTEDGAEISNTDNDYLPDNDELFEGYVNKAFGIDNIMPYSSLAGDRLTGNDRIIYDFVKEKIAEVASGTLSSTDFQLPASNLLGYQKKWLKEDLGVNIVENDTLNPDAIEAIHGKIPCDFKKVSNAIMSDFPYELYWYNKTIGRVTGYGFKYSYNDSYIELSDDSVIKFYLVVDPTYAATNDTGEKEKYKTDAEKLSSIPTAVQNAKNIVSEATDKSDYEKILYYRKAIRNLTEYNYDALKDGYAKGDINPWQLIYVFDGNPDTKVVCEGFSKAFQYLCDETSFSNKHILSYIVTGTMAGGTGSGPHMWNLIHIGNKGNYLIDVTNAPANNVRFLSGYTSKDNDTYVFAYPNFTGDDGKNYLGGTTHYQFDSDTLSTFSAEELNIAEGYGPLTEEDFKDTDAHTGETTIREASCTEAGEKKTVCTWCGETSIETIEPLGHKWDEGKITKKPSCSDGEINCTPCQGHFFNLL